MRLFFILICLIAGAPFLHAQDEQEEAFFPIETFRSYRLVNGHSAEPVWKNNLVLTFSHRFHGPISGGVREFWGFDQYADIRFGFAYGITDRLTVELGRTRTGKIYDLGVKYKFLQQEPGKMPFSATFLSSAAATTTDFPANQEESLEFKHRLGFIQQVFIARKFGERLGLQASGAWIRQNLARHRGEENDTYLLGAGGRIQVSGIFHLSAEYYHPLNNRTRDDKALQPVAGIGFDFITPRHAFQLTIGNNKSLLEQEFMTQTTQNFFYHRGLLLGFHITRNFGL